MGKIPSHHPFLDVIFPNKNHPAMGGGYCTPRFQETSIIGAMKWNKHD